MYLCSTDFQLNCQDNSVGKRPSLHQVVLKSLGTYANTKKLASSDTQKKFNSNLIKDFNVKVKFIKLVVENIGENLSELGIGTVFLNRT